MKSIKNARLVDSDIPGLRARLASGQSTVAEEADRFGVGIETIRRANRGETFRHIPFGLDQPKQVVERRAGFAVPSEEINRSLEKLQGMQRQESGENPVDFFLEARKTGLPKNPLDEIEGEGNDDK